jgi:hypothetical protein
MKRFLIAAGCISLLSSIVCANYWCDCALNTPNQWFKAADDVFIGVVVQPGEDNGRAGATAHFKATQTLKGKVRGEVAVAYDIGGSQAVQFKNGSSCLVYSAGENDLSTDSCCGTKPLYLAKKDLQNP